MSSKVTFDPTKPSLGHIRAGYVVPPHSPASIKRCISRVERTSAFAQADPFADMLSGTQELRCGLLSRKVTSQFSTLMAWAWVRISWWSWWPLFKLQSWPLQDGKLFLLFWHHSVKWSSNFKPWLIRITDELGNLDRLRFTCVVDTYLTSWQSGQGRVRGRARRR